MITFRGLGSLDAFVQQRTQLQHNEALGSRLGYTGFLCWRCVPRCHIKLGYRRAFSNQRSLDAFVQPPRTQLKPGSLDAFPRAQEAIWSQEARMRFLGPKKCILEPGILDAFFRGHVLNARSGTHVLRSTFWIGHQLTRMFLATARTSNPICAITTHSQT